MQYLEIHGEVMLHPYGRSSFEGSFSLTWEEVREIVPSWDAISVEAREHALEAWYWE